MEENVMNNVVTEVVEDTINETCDVAVETVSGKNSLLKPIIKTAVKTVATVVGTIGGLKVVDKLTNLFVKAEIKSLEKKGYTVIKPVVETHEEGEEVVEDDE